MIYMRDELRLAIIKENETGEETAIYTNGYYDLFVTYNEERVINVVCYSNNKALPDLKFSYNELGWQHEIRYKIYGSFKHFMDLDEFVAYSAIGERTASSGLRILNDSEEGLFMKAQHKQFMQERWDEMMQDMLIKLVTGEDRIEGEDC